MEELKTIKSLIEGLRRLPGIGQKSAERMAYQILEMEETKIDQLVSALSDVKNNISICPVCGGYTEKGICPFCCDSTKSSDQLVVVSYFKDALAFEKLNSYFGSYHILNGVISPSKGISIDDLNIHSLLKRVKEDGVKEVIIATNPTIDGETTALYIKQLLATYHIEVTRLAYGLPIGSQLDYADELTLTRALEGRRKI